MDFGIIKKESDFIRKLFPTRTPTPTPTYVPPPTSTPSPQPTAVPTETLTPTKTPAPTVTSVKKTVEETTQNLPAVTTQPSPTIISPTPATKQSLNQKALNQKEMILYGIIGFLVLILLFQSRSKIKKWLHEKTG